MHSKKKHFLHVRFFGACILLLSVLGFIIGILKSEIVLLLSGVILFTPLLYCFIVILLLGALHKNKAFNLDAKICPVNVCAGAETYLVLNERVSFWTLPAILIRYKLNLTTKDNFDGGKAPLATKLRFSATPLALRAVKKNEHIFSKDFFKADSPHSFTAPLRGAYYGSSDIILLQDIFGFFNLSLTVQQGSGERLIVCPTALKNTEFEMKYAKGSEKRSENKIVKSDELLDQRIYVPGDDPRRINWKLYSHAGELFVRTEEQERPPHSKLVLLIDTEACPYTFSPQEAAFELDAVCAAALSIIEENERVKTVTELGWTSKPNGIETPANAAAAAVLLAFPSICSINSGAQLTLPSDKNTGTIIILSLPRKIDLAKTEQTSLTKFISGFKNNRKEGHTIELFFCYTKDRAFGLAQACALQFYNTNGVHAKAVKL
ncbi:MAG: hypothetical protein Ta2F_12400 [Termitinemataceae bacterium]|nr:MAG: hypothetical protein Ta2F_12400 [Termitinemataceae bacterium]